VNLRAVNAGRGFVLPVVLGIILLVALFAMQSATELGGTTTLATRRVLQQRAFEAGESGLLAVLEQLQAGAEPASRQQLRSAGIPADTATVESRVIARLALPNGYSTGRVLEAEYEIRSTGHSMRATAVTVVQGVRQLQALPQP
jgi:Tfp pilus assembly protein PilX